MKKPILFFVLLITSVMTLQAQDKNEKLNNTMEVVVVKTVTVKGIEEVTTETTIVEKEKQVIETNDSGVENQNVVYSSKKEIEEKETKSSTVNKENEAAIAAIKEKQKAEIEASKKELLAKYEVKKIEIDKKRAEELKKRNWVKKDN